MTELSREEVLKIAGKHVGYRHGEYFFPYGCHDSAFLEAEGAPKLYSEAQLLAIYEAGAKSERAVSDRLMDALKLVIPLAKGYAATNRVGSNSAYCLQAESLIEFVEALRKEKPE